jgi:hypothetical protein
VVGGDDPDDVLGVIDGVQNPVVAAARGVVTREVKLQRPTHTLRVVGERPVDELDTVTREVKLQRPTDTLWVVGERPVDELDNGTAIFSGSL